MEHINETITLGANECLEVEISRITFIEPAEVGQPSHPTWVKAQFTPSEIVSNVHTTMEMEGVCEFTEDALEAYLKQWLEYHFNCGIKSFRWMWDKFRNYKAA